MSTADSLLLTASSAVVRDLMQESLKLKMTDDQVKKGTSIATLIITFVTAALSMLNLPMVVMISVMQLTVVGAAFMPSLILGIWWKKGTSKAAAASIACGIIVPVLLFTVLKSVNPFGHPFWPSLITSFLVYIIVSLKSKPLPKEFVDDMFDYNGWEKKEADWN